MQEDMELSPFSLMWKYRITSTTMQIVATPAHLLWNDCLIYVAIRQSHIVACSSSLKRSELAKKSFFYVVPTFSKVLHFNKRETSVICFKNKITASLVKHKMRFEMRRSRSSENESLKTYHYVKSISKKIKHLTISPRVERRPAGCNSPPRFIDGCLKGGDSTRSLSNRWRNCRFSRPVIQAPCAAKPGLRLQNGNALGMGGFPP